MRRVAILVGLVSLGAAASARAQSVTAQPVRTTESAVARARADSLRRPYTKHDIDFVAGMIHHHGQAILMAGWGASHSTTPSVRTLCERIINAQKDEIRLMQQWLVDRKLAVPDPNPYGMAMDMGGTSHEMLMPGMLTRQQLARLDSARGQEFDQLFLTYMIQHHRGATLMVTDLFGTNGGGQDETMFKVASDIHVDQTTEIARMQKMLTALALGQPY